MTERKTTTIGLGMREINAHKILVENMNVGDYL